MYTADLRHSRPGLEQKLQALYNLNRSIKIDLSFRPPYLNLLQAFGNPHRKLPPAIHIAGTNGKGSVIAMLRAMLEEAGYSVHAYTSPHLYEFNERIVLNGNPIDDGALESLIDRALVLNNDAETTFFEITTAMAFTAFDQNPADILLLETGLGGRLDCTNIIDNPIATTITTISFDHMEFLGDTLEEIAAEKAGILKKGSPCILGPGITPAAEQVILSKAKSLGADIYRSNPFLPYKSNLIGPHQMENIGTALATLEAIQEQFPVSGWQIASGLQKVNWPGRLQQFEVPGLPPGWEFWFDGGHNPAAAKALAAQAALWQVQDGCKLHIIIGMKKDKNIEAFIQELAPYAASLQLVALEGMESHSCAPGAEFAGTLAKALASLPEEAKGRMLLCGSLYLAQPLKAFGAKPLPAKADLP